MKNPKKPRPPAWSAMSVSRKTEDAEMWAKSVEKPKEKAIPPVVEPLLVSEETASTMLRISPRFVWELGEQGRLRVKRIGRRKLYLVSSLKAYAEAGSEVQ